MDSNNSSFSNRQWETMNENLDIRFDTLEKQVEQVLKVTRHVLDECSELNAYVDAMIDEDSHGGENSSLSLSDQDFVVMVMILMLIRRMMRVVNLMMKNLILREPLLLGIFMQRM